MVVIQDKNKYKWIVLYANETKAKVFSTRKEAYKFNSEIKKEIL